MVLLLMETEWVTQGPLINPAESASLRPFFLAVENLLGSGIGLVWNQGTKKGPCGIIGRHLEIVKSTGVGELDRFRHVG